MKYTIYFLIITAFFSCNKTDNPNSTNSNELIYNTKMSVSDKYYGTFYSQKDKVEYVYFANVSTEKTIIFFEINKSKAIYEVDLSEVLQSERNGIENISIISMDTIIVLGKYSNNLYFINRDGEVWKDLQLGNSSHFINDYELSCSISNNFILDNNSIILSPYWFYTNDTINENWGDIEYVRLERKNRWDSPYFMKFSNIFEENPNSDTGHFQYQHHFPNKPFCHFIEYNNYFIHKGDIYLASLFSNKIVQLNGQNFEVINELEIKSEHTSIGMPLIPIGSEIRNYEQEFIDSFFSKGSIRKMFFNEKTQCFYITVCIESKDNKIHNSNSTRDWLTMIYDKDFNIITEYKIDNKKFYNSFLNTMGGVYIQVKNKKDYKKQKVVFKKLNLHSTVKKTEPLNKSDTLYLKGETKDYNKIEKYLVRQDTEIKLLKSILILTNQGVCMNCNKKFARTIENYTSRSDTKIIVTAEGNSIDISSFLDSKNVILDFNDEFSQLGLTKGTSAIFLENGKIDTILNIKANLLEKQLTYIQQQTKE